MNLITIQKTVNSILEKSYKPKSQRKKERNKKKKGKKERDKQMGKRKWPINNNV